MTTMIIIYSSLEGDLIENEWTMEKLNTKVMIKLS